MNHACTCGHQPADHYGDTGACEALDDGRDFPCKCPHYEWQGDD